MNPTILLGLIVGIPVVMALTFRISAVFLFLAAVSGSLLGNYIADDVKIVLDMAVRTGDTLVFAQFGLILVPLLFTLIFMRKTMPKSRIIFNIVPVLVTGLCIAVLVLPYMAADAQAQLSGTVYGKFLIDSQDAIVAVAALLNLFLAWTVHHTKAEKHGKGK